MAVLRIWTAAVLLLVQPGLIDCSIDTLYKEICRRRLPEEYFRLSVGAENCQEAFSCSAVDHLNALRCPLGHWFDVERQLCEWSDHVTNCDRALRSPTPRPILFSEACRDEEAACADGTCLALHMFCDSVADCADGSDESTCDVGNDPGGASPCPDVTCSLPDCFCSQTGTLPPRNMSREEVPMMIAITFTGAVTSSDFPVYEVLFDPSSRRNPNGCSLKATFFVSHQRTNYSLVNELHRRGHEVASNTVSRGEDAAHWSKSVWLNESLGQRKILSRFAQIPLEDIRGFRSPRLGGNRQFAALREAGYSYDASMVAPRHLVPLYPYTLDAKIPHPCHKQDYHCPTRAFLKLWEFPTNELVSHGDDNFTCAAVGDVCGAKDPAETYELLSYNFLRHFHTNRAPFIIRLDAQWLRQDHSRLGAVRQWLDDVLEERGSEVYFVTVSDALRWMRDPARLESAKFIREWYRGSCRWLYQMPESTCTNRRCLLRAPSHRPGERMYLDSCVQECPDRFPWTDDIEGSGDGDS